MDVLSVLEMALDVASHYDEALVLDVAFHYDEELEKDVLYDDYHDEVLVLDVALALDVAFDYDVELLLVSLYGDDCAFGERLGLDKAFHYDVELLLVSWYGDELLVLDETCHYDEEIASVFWCGNDCDYGKAFLCIDDLVLTLDMACGADSTGVHRCGDDCRPDTIDHFCYDGFDRPCDDEDDVVHGHL